LLIFVLILSLHLNAHLLCRTPYFESNHIGRPVIGNE